MPIPKVKSNEKQYEYISRCYKSIKDEYNRPQAFAICYQTWKDNK